MKAKSSVFLVGCCLAVAAVCGCVRRTPGPEPESAVVEAVTYLCWNGRYDKLAPLLEKHPELANVRDADGYTPLLAAVMSGDNATVELLLKTGARADVASPDDGTTPLHYVAANGWVHLAEMTLAAGGDPEARDRDGGTPLIWAATGGHIDTVQLLLRMRPGVADLDRAVLEAALGGYDSVVSLLLSKRPGGARALSFWRPAEGTGADRMWSPRIRSHGYELYRALWKTDNGDRLVCFRYPGCELGGTPYSVWVFDREMKLLRTGDTTVGQDYFPYALVEVYSESVNQHETLRGKWALAVVSVWSGTVLDPARPMRLVGFDAPRYEHANDVSAKLIDWSDNVDIHKLYVSDLEDVKFRWAEPGPSIFTNLPRKPSKD